MRIDELIHEINKSIEELDFVTARKYIEENIEELNQKRSHLKGNARDLLKFLSERLESGHKPISRQEMATITAINSYAKKFDLRGLKMVIKDHAQLLLREDVPAYLNSDAKIILEGMGAIVKK